MLSYGILTYTIPVKGKGCQGVLRGDIYGPSVRWEDTGYLCHISRAGVYGPGCTCSMGGQGAPGTRNGGRKAAKVLYGL